ncbi:hypothetical protein HBA54_00925 [Pelagibius litoralis]|uniref:Uncharacterized protein n=1 Tax=Pelagibius litoralis TaxID=374515 RepID=A0A967C2L0_9PROT|nr:hypothetical protein [Pelagibius litoralis]NIA67150.1 hypothetical protein [Pelagibius litoralis]
MLTVELDLERINEAQAGYLKQRTRRGAHFANQVRVFRDAFVYAAKRLAERQSAAAAKGAPLLVDGTQQTLEDQLFGPLATEGWPKRAAAVLHGLHLPARPLLKAMPCCPGGPNWSVLDGDSYLAQLDDGPPQERELGDTTALAVYLAPLCRLRLLWIGAESEYPQAVARLGQETRLWADWRPVSPDYADWLDNACRAGLKGPETADS